ncbi:MAG: hypothetical protein ACREEY_02625 [Brevundimonas sp.]
MTCFTIRYSGRGTGVLRTEILAVESALSAVTHVKRRLGASQIFRAASVFEDDAFRFRVTTGGGAAVSSALPGSS